MRRKKSDRDDETLIGIVMPVQWAIDDQISAVALSATDDEAYWIVNGEKFVSLIQKRIEACGTVRRDRKETRSIRIKRYRVVDDY